MSNNDVATAEQLQAASGRRRYDHTTLPTSGLRVRFQSLTEFELSRFEAEVVASSGRSLRKDRIADGTRRFLVRVLVDSTGNRLYHDDQADQLGNWDSLDTQHLSDVCGKHVGLKADHIEGLVKNSEGVLVEDTPSG